MIRIPLIAVVLSAALNGASPVRILIAYHSETGHTERLAKAVHEGITSVNGVSVILRKTQDVRQEDIAAADGIAIGTPVHWHNLSAETKRFIDRIGEVLAKTGKNWGDGRTGA